MSRFLVVVGAVLCGMLPGAVRGQGIVVDHTTLQQFDSIPDQYLQAARNLRVLFMDRSVGINTTDALNCLTASSYDSSRVTCRRDFREVNGSWELILRNSADVASGLVPTYIQFSPSPTRYNRANWDFFIFADTWDKMATDFISGLHNRAIPADDPVSGASVLIDPLDYDVVSFQWSYLNVDEGSSIASFFTHLPGDYDDVYDLEREVNATLTSASPPRVFVYWTTSLARSIGTDVATEFNQLMRQWCIDNNKILFDFADIEAYDMNGNPCYDNRDGVPYTTPSGNASENHPSDGVNIPAVCQEKTLETDGGHLGTAQGVISVAKGFWLLVAEIAGWSPGGSTQPPLPPTNLRVTDVQ
ncbi:MAG: hypothetical protein WAO20_06830 [Acidobacteriota bacterium]